MSEKLFYTMGEVAEMFDVNQSLIRYWESQFRVLRPKRNKKGNRLFTPEDIRNLKLIYHLVKERGMTLDGAKKALRQAAADGAAMNRDAELMERLQHIRSLLEEVREDLKSGTPEGESAAEAAAVDERPARRRRERPVVKIAPEAAAPETAAAGADGDADAAPAAAAAPAAGRRTARRPRRKKEEAENKELFAFYEQSLF
ncbi:MerR family transcriptional regulator [uncultured Alistipes sp.]|uniref:MerR family transcriptional regulator n=1 Tax=uncultured Alistipes sp. TaxID=538949 RepID=UPI00261ACD63|nr:MerR family transcriptional regulator [uncultured Alistipes sp.]